MAITALSGPLVVFGQQPAGVGPTPDYNPDLGPSLFYAGAGILDPRAAYSYAPGQGSTALTAGFVGMDNITTLNVVPYTAASAAIVASANPTSATLTLVSAASATTGVSIIPSIVRADTNVVDTGVSGAGLVGIDTYASFTASIAGTVMTVTANSAGPICIGMTLLTAGGTGTLASGVTVVGYGTGVGYVGTYIVSTSQTIGSGTITASLSRATLASGIDFGSNGGLTPWNPMAILGRAVSITAAASATYTTATVNGYDVYGYPMTEAITITAASTVNGKKAFKYIRSVVLSGGTADTTHAYSVGTTDIIGLPIRSDFFGDILVNYAASLTATTLVTAATGYTASVQTTPSTTTGDVRGTYTLQSASSTGANRLIIRQSPQLYNVGSIAGLFGATQFSAF